MAQKIFKIPDGNGGFTYQIQTPDGKWHITDEKGNPIPEEREPSTDKLDEVPVSLPNRRARKKTTTRSGELSFVQFSMKIPKEEYKVLSSYVLWRSLFKEPLSRSEMLLQAGLDSIRKDREYREFLKKNPEISG